MRLHPVFLIALSSGAFLFPPLSSWADQPAGSSESRDSIDDPLRGVVASPARANSDQGLQIRGNTEDDGHWTLQFGGFLRTRYTHIENDPAHEIFGRNDGFSLSDARFITRGSLDDKLGFVLSFDAGSRVVRSTPDSPVDRLAARMTDTYLFYAPSDFLELNAGQFKAPFDREDLISTSTLLFVNRSVANRGIQGVEGFNVPGLSQDRQIGVRAHGSFFPLADSHSAADGPGLSYALAIANGNGPNLSLNNNDKPAYYGRLNLHWGDLVSIGGALFHHDDTLGDPPNQVDRLRWGWTADLLVQAYGASLLANVIGQEQQTPELPQEPELSALGYQVQLAYEEPFFGFQPAYRFAYYDPDNQLQDRARTHHTIGLNYNDTTYPLRLMANYTIALEEEAVEMDNNRLDLVVQLTW